jgi:hypothetical protein
MNKSPAKGYPFLEPPTREALTRLTPCKPLTDHQPSRFLLASSSRARRARVSHSFLRARHKIFRISNQRFSPRMERAVAAVYCYRSNATTQTTARKGAADPRTCASYPADRLRFALQVLEAVLFLP